MNQRQSMVDKVFMGTLYVGGAAVVIGLMIATVRSMGFGSPRTITVKVSQPETITLAPPEPAKSAPPPKPPRDWGGFGKDAGKGVGSFTRGIVTGAIEGVLGTEEKKEEETPKPEADSEPTKS